ncbi:ribonuclease HI [Halalkalicoccus subterraneus]|uniref:ribonuclease HI n=1 Tax=Halalkalicoccus subterraneus TaxID=2675002 RepID=UPI000EFAE6BE|nr:ribonuclease HI [Halalkalicoccus subterraneus]
MPSVPHDPDEAREKLAAAGATIEDGNTDHERWRARLGEANAIAYEETVVVQGARPADIESILRDGGGRVHLYFDGGSRGNPGPAAIGWVLVSGDGIVADGGERIGETTNNRAEYEALIRGLEVAIDYGFDDVEIRGDSQLVVKQTRGEWDANDPGMRERRVRVHELLGGFDEWSITHVPREVNERADELVNEAFEHG